MYRLKILPALLAACTLLAQASAPQVRSQAPGYYRIMLGDFEITALSDGTHAFPIDTVMTHISPQQVAQDLTQAGATQPLQGSINAFLINTGKRLVLVDTGAGALYGDCCGKLLAHLRAAGYRPEQVDDILLTHLHKDHVGGVLTQGAPAFPNARLRLSQREADYWLSAASKADAPAFLASFFDSAQAALAPYRANGHLLPFDTDSADSADGTLLPGITALAGPGHTPGHTMYLVQSKGQQLLIWGDVVHVAALQLPHPAASVKYDSDDTAAQRTRAQLLQRAAQQHLLIGAAHIAFPGLGQIRQRGDGYEWLPLNYDGAP